jgi:hypothetical protein
LPRGQRAALAGGLVCALGLAFTLFTLPGATAAWRLLQTPFVVARLSTVLSSLLLVGICAALVLMQERLLPGRRWLDALVLLALVSAATRLLGQAPQTFAEHVSAALAPQSERRALLMRLKARALLLARTVPRGSTVLTTARFARQLVMLRDCYVLAADRGHTHVQGIDLRRRDLVFLNAADTSWAVRQKLIEHYDLTLVTFETRWQRRYRWVYERGRVLGSEAGLDVVELRR